MTACAGIVSGTQQGQIGLIVPATMVVAIVAVVPTAAVMPTQRLGERRCRLLTAVIGLNQNP
jgi:hypothetical protein